MSEQPTPVTPEAPASPAGVTDDQASALLADAVAAAERDESALDEHSQKVVAAIRNDFKAERAKRQAAETALSTSAEAARAELTASIAKALGLNKDETPDPVKLTEQLTTQTAEARQARVELAVYRAAGSIADPSALLDSTSFLASLKDIDPTDSAAVTAAITSAVASNPRLGAAPGTPRPPAPNPAQGSSASGSGAPDFKKQIADAMKAGDIGLSIALEEQRAASLKTKS